MKKRGDERSARTHGANILRGTISVTSRATGFVADEKKRGGDIMIETANLNTALNRDEVEIELLKGRVRGRRVGAVTRVVARAKTRFVGTLETGEGAAASLVLIPDDFRMYTQIRIPRPPREARQGLKALVELRGWQKGHQPEGEILNIIGRKGEHETEMRSIVLERGFESSFSPEAEREARALERASGAPLPDGEIRRRRDFRGCTLFTIDPSDAKDFDDALSWSKLKNGRYEVGVHIADVSHYVREGSVLDCEARERGTSVYLVDRTIPMLPEALSNNLCSLKPNVDRLAFSAVFEMDENGRVHSRWFGKTVIRSQKRFTYEEAQRTIEGGGACAAELKTLNALAKTLRRAKEKAGAIDFEHDEVGFELDETGRPIRVFKKARLDTHKLVEEFMLLANREVAEYFWKASRRSGGKIPFVYRVHDAPDSEKLEELRVFVRALGHELPLGKTGRIRGTDLKALFKKIEGKAEESLIKTAALRSMAKAEYSTQNIGHFGLAFEYYTHFTSPIRRYPDLLVHRLLFSLLQGHRLEDKKFAALTGMARDATRREIAAAEAERESVKLKQVEYMRQFLGEEFEGMISGVTEWGIYVEEKETKAEGMVPLRTLADDFYRLDERNYRVVGTRSKKKYALGDRVRVRVTGADTERKTLEYALV